MGARGSKSRKPSGASSGPSKPRDLVFFTDKSLGLRIVPEALRAAGEHVELKTDHFEEDTPDTVWVKEVGLKGWIILSKDKHLRHNLIEIAALLKSNTHSFLLTSGNYTGEEMANAFLAAMPHMKAIVERIPPPMIATVTKSGTVKILYTHDDLIEKLSRPPGHHC